MQCIPKFHTRLHEPSLAPVLSTKRVAAFPTGRVDRRAENSFVIVIEESLKLSDIGSTTCKYPVRATHRL